MTHPDQADAIDTWVGALRSDYEPTPRVVRERIAERLAGAGLAAVAVGGAVALAKAAPRGFLYSKAFVAILTLPVGIVLGATGQAFLARPAVVPAAVRALPVPSVVATVELPRAVEPVQPLEAVQPLEPVQPQPAAPKARPSSSAAALETPGLAHELRLLEHARTKLSEGQPAAALEQLRQHRAQYPQSALEQERDALSVRALMATGRRAEARERAAAFVQRYPKSVLRGSVERAVGTIP